MSNIESIKVKIFADGADKNGIIDLCKLSYIKGFTTNPTLIRKAGITDYKKFAMDILPVVKGKPFSFEVFADDFDEMERQAGIISQWGPNVYVKIPITNTKGVSAAPLIRRLAEKKMKLNITAMMTLDQVREVVPSLKASPSSYVSIFAGRVADTGQDPVPCMAEAVKIMSPFPNLELIWASPRELLNIFQAAEIGCHIITVTHDVLKKLSLVGKNLTEYSRETVQMFYDDGLKTGFKLEA